jgi:hypothetical protein
MGAMMSVGRAGPAILTRVLLLILTNVRRLFWSRAI